jgi:hypothetical protein
MTRELLLRTTHGTQHTKGVGTVIAIEDERVVWLQFGEGRLKFPSRMLKGSVEIGARIRFVQVGDTIRKVEKL